MRGASPCSIAVLSGESASMAYSSADARDRSNRTASQKLKDRFSQSAKFAPVVRHTRAFSTPWQMRSDAQP